MRNPIEELKWIRKREGNVDYKGPCSWSEIYIEGGVLEKQFIWIVTF
jgi:hypothetical protein